MSWPREQRLTANSYLFLSFCLGRNHGEYVQFIKRIFTARPASTPAILESTIVLSGHHVHIRLLLRALRETERAGLWWVNFLYGVYVVMSYKINRKQFNPTLLTLCGEDGIVIVVIVVVVVVVQLYKSLSAWTCTNRHKNSIKR
jgi:hypothetical protein